MPKALINFFSMGARIRIEDFISENGMGSWTHVLLDAEPTSSLMSLSDSSLN